MLQSVEDAVTHVYRSRYRWWYLVELARRLLFVVIVVSTLGTPVSGVVATWLPWDGDHWSSYYMLRHVR